MITDESIDVAFRTLSAQHQRVTGPQVRDWLRQVHGRVGSTARINRRVQELRRGLDLQEQDRQLEQLQARNRELEAQLDTQQKELAAILARAELAEERERSHQNLWANQIYDLRQENRALKSARVNSKQAEERYLQVHRDLLAARTHIASLEEELRGQKIPAAGEGG